ncbi:aminotransferase class I/II-fold pyridoxal phosphate-dependent enzyme [Gryllotalpicola daejeonensis]|uniref:cysteine-S-conjugate beta-lyase n=1 Tax=Gryllotalpicola daejeonensis TaxID=993087 RepID=A0ABP7ZID0_9MICO
MTFEPALPLPELRRTRSSIKWRRYPEGVLPLFVAEMDWGIAPEITAELTDVLAKGNTGYLDNPGPLAPAFADFALASWGWQVDPARVHLATDVTVGIVETLRLELPPVGGRVVITPPVYNPFYEMVGETNSEAVEVPLVEASDWSLDLAGIDAAFRSGAQAMILCHPQNPTGRVHTRESLAELARIAAEHDVLIVSDEVHAPLTHPGTEFVPFAVVAAETGARSVTVTSASKGWNLAAVKCAVAVANDAATAALLEGLPEELAARTSLLGLNANVTAFANTYWRDAARDRIVANVALLEAELAKHAPSVKLVRPNAGYLVWLDFRDTELGDDPAAVLREVGRVAFNSGPSFGSIGRGFARANLACEASTVVEAVQRIARTLAAVTANAAAASAR